MTGADLTDGDFYRNDFTGADLTGAKLTDAILPRSVFTGATLGGADLSGAFLLRSRFEGVDLSGVQGLVQVQIDQACGDAQTLLPAGLVAPASWPCSDS